jgi:hypothetical protein
MDQSIQRCGVTRHPKRKSESDFPKRGKKFPENFWSVGFFKKMSKGFDVDSVEVEMSSSDMKKLIKKYKKLKKFQKSNLHTIETLGGKDTIIEKLIRESDGYEL